MQHVSGSEDIFRSECEVLVCPVNTVGVMGAGLAKACAERWPQLEASYKQACRAGDVRIGQVWSFTLPTGDPSRFRAVICLPTKAHWRHPSRMEYVIDGLSALRDEVQYMEYRSVAIPALGCGLGGLRWDLVREHVQQAMSDLADVHVVVYGPRDE